MFHVKCKACGRTFHGWADINVCSICGGKLEEIEEVNYRPEGIEKKEKKFLKLLKRIFRAIFWPRSYRW